MRTQTIIITSITVFIIVALAALLYFILKPNLPKTKNYEIKNVIDTLPKHSSKTYRKRSVNEIRKIVVHHSACIGNNCNAAAYATYHVNSRGWAGIGYHYVIEKDGTIKQCNHDTTISAHCAGQNTNSIGVSLSGDFTREPLTDTQKLPLIWLLKHLRSKYGNLDITQHKDFSPTACPGDIDFDNLKKQIILA
jgi:N-acetyl-anhydromuramyl-L-alanine amidase AmpD